MKILFMLPGSIFTHGFVKSWTKTIVWAVNKHQIDVKMQTGSDIYQLREALVQGTQDKKYDRYMWIDSDIMWEPSDLEKIFSHDLDVVSGLYALTGPISWPPMVKAAAMVKILKDGRGGFQMLNALHLPPDDRPDLIKVDGVGFGFVSIKPQVFLDIGQPYFWSRFVPLPDGNVGVSSEDLGWCYAAQEKGYDIWLDHTIKLKHQKSQDLGV
jgi:hypothetical protein